MILVCKLIYKIEFNFLKIKNKMQHFDFTLSKIIETDDLKELFLYEQNQNFKIDVFILAYYNKLFLSLIPSPELARIY